MTLDITENEHFNAVNNRFPHIGAKIEFLWGHSEFDRYINTLFTDTRDSQRRGFPIEIADALMKLQSLHDRVFPGINNHIIVWEPCKRDAQ